METIQIHNITIDPFTFTIAFQRNDVRSIDKGINTKSTRILKIPPSLALIAMFYNQVLTPFEEIDKVCEDDLRTLLAWDIIYMLDPLVSQNPPSFRCTAHLLFAAASLEKINDLPQIYLDKASNEIEAYRKNEIKLEDSMYAEFLIEDIETHISPFLKDYLLHLNPKGRTKCIRSIQDLYHYLAHTYVVQIPNITYHPKVFDVLDN